MQFLTLSEKEIKTPAIYSAISIPHIVISISGGDDNETVVPVNHSCVGALHLKFDDVEDIMETYVYFDRAIATEILDFVEKHVTKVSLIVVQCQAGLSRSVGVASALAKIINGKDDDVFTKGIPNMFVYTTILDQFFGNPHWSEEYSKINMVRNKMLMQLLPPAVYRLGLAKNRKRSQE